MSRKAKEPAPQYTLTAAIAAAVSIQRLRTEAGDPDLDLAFPASITDDVDIDAVVAYVERHRRVSARVRSAELADRAKLVEYQRQRDVKRHERSLFAVLHTGHALGVQPRSYGVPMGLNSRQAVYERRTGLLKRRRDIVELDLGDEGRAREWLEEHARAIRALGDMLVDCRDELLNLVDGAARKELAVQIDAVGTLMARRVSQEFCTAVAMSVNLLRPTVARESSDLAVREQIAYGLRLLW